MIRRYLEKILYRTIVFIAWVHESLILRLHLLRSRNEAHFIRRKVIKRKGAAVVNRIIKKSIKEYSKQRFGNTSYWPWLALYTEIRGCFIKGWLPYDYFRFILLPKINPQAYCAISEHKTLDYRIFREFAVVPLFTCISNEYFNSDLKSVPISEVKTFFSRYNKLIVIKEEEGYGGKQVSIIHSSTFMPEHLKSNKNYIIQPYIEQHQVIDDLYPGSVNTFRVYSYLNDDSIVSIKFVILRFGIDGSKVDNLALGGNYLYIDLNGKPSKLIYDFDLGYEIGERHKNTGYFFSELKIPMFKNILEKCIAAHKKYPYVRFIGWDVCVDRSGEPKLIEWNADNPGFWQFEARFGPFWSDNEGVSKFPMKQRL